jgi:nucleoside-diphosphate-sugar epimerase
VEEPRIPEIDPAFDGSEPAPPAAAGDRVVVIGGTGFLGRHLVADLSAAGPARVVVVARRAAPDLPPGCRFRSLDVETDPAAVAELVPAGAAVVNLVDLGRGAAGGPRHVEIARELLAACARAGAGRLVHVSTVAVAGLGPRGLADETAPCRPADAYQRRKLEVEETLRREAPAELDLVVLRPTAVFGDGGRSLVALAGSLARGRRSVNWARSCLFARRAMHLVPVETVVAAVRWALAQPEPFAGETFLVSADDEAGNTFRPVERALMAALGVPDYRLAPRALPPPLLSLLLRASGRLRIHPNARFSPARLRSRGFSPPIPFAEALARHARRLAAAR